jgi:hypothetical protein
MIKEELVMRLQTKIRTPEQEKAIGMGLFKGFIVMGLFMIVGRITGDFGYNLIGLFVGNAIFQISIREAKMQEARGVQEEHFKPFSKV